MQLGNNMDVVPLPLAFLWILLEMKKSENCQVSGMLLRREASWFPPISWIFWAASQSAGFFFNCEDLGVGFSDIIFFGIFTYIKINIREGSIFIF